MKSPACKIKSHDSLWLEENIILKKIFQDKDKCLREEINV